MLDALKFELDVRVYYYGAQFRHPWESQVGGVHRFWPQVVYLARSLRSTLTAPSGDSRPLILSNAYFSTDQELEKFGYRLRKPPWEICSDLSLLPTLIRAKHALRNWALFELGSSRFSPVYRSVWDGLKSYVLRHDVRALVVCNDIGFFENVAIRVFRELGRPSFIFLHGLPGRYNRFDDTLADYLVVWGEAVRCNFIAAGVSADKILVGGHPTYREIPADAGKRWGLSDLLVLSKAMNGAQNRRETILADRGNCLLYVDLIRRTLERAGVSSFRLRLHPSENPAWYSEQLRGMKIDIDFSPLEVSLKRASLVIGPTTTVFLESLLHGTQYLVFEPGYQGFDLQNNRLVPPFDGSDPRVPVATDVETLARFLKEQVRIDVSLLSEYIRTPLFLDVMSGKIASRNP